MPSLSLRVRVAACAPPTPVVLLRVSAALSCMCTTKDGCQPAASAVCGSQGLKRTCSAAATAEQVTGRGHWHGDDWRCCKQRPKAASAFRVLWHAHPPSWQPAAALNDDNSGCW